MKRKRKINQKAVKRLVNKGLQHMKIKPPKR
jgi:hypothetical protein